MPILVFVSPFARLCCIFAFSCPAISLASPGVAKSSTSFAGWGKDGNVSSVGWQVTLCDLIRHVSSCSSVVGQTANCYVPILLI